MTPVEFLAARWGDLEALECQKFRRRKANELTPADLAKYGDVTQTRYFNPNDPLGIGARWPDGQWMTPTEVEAWRAATEVPNPDPYVLADLAAKRRLIELAQDATGLDMSVDNDRGVGVRDWLYIGDVMVRVMCLPFADHPDYQKEWAL